MHNAFFVRPALAAVALLATAGMAFAHVTVAPTTAGNGSAVKLVFTVPHGCDGAATTALDVKLPEGFVVAKPQPKAGWTLDITNAPYAKAYKVYGEAVSSGAVEIKWSGGNLPDDEFDEFAIQGNIQGFDAPTRLVFPATQVCGDKSVGWTDVPAAGSSAKGLKHPAPGLDVTLAPADDPMAGMDMSGMGSMDMGTKPAAAPTAKGGAAAVTLGDLTISGGFARAMLPGQPTGGGYVTIANAGKADDTLLSASSPAAASVTLHSMTMNGNIMEMRALPQGIPVPAGGSVTLSPNGLHLMFEKVTAPFKAGASVPVTLTFAKAGSVVLSLPVGAIGATGPGQ